MEEQKKYTPISELGEFGLIQRLTDKIELYHTSTIKGVGDDAAVFTPPGKDYVQLFSTDMLAEGIHFELTYTPLRQLGYKAIAANVSDICAMNGVATQAAVSIAVSNQYSVESLDEIYKGIHYACEKYKVDLVGGDTTSSRSGLIISVAILGKVAQDKVVYRSGAKAGDYLCVSGDLGAAYAGLYLLEKARKNFIKDPTLKPDFQGYSYVIQRQLMPKARTDMIELFRLSDVKPNSMIDISDGLSSEINHLCKESKVGCLLDEANIPIHEETLKVATSLNTPADDTSEIHPWGGGGGAATSFALNGGEDYQLLFTLAPSDYKKLKDTTGITIIGEMLPAQEGIKLAGKDGKIYPLEAKGWDGMKA